MTDNAIRSALTHANAMIHMLAPVSRREVQNYCTRRLLRDRAWQAQARVLFRSSSCFFSWDAETGYKQQWAWISSQPLLLQREMKTSKKSPLSQIDVCVHMFTFPPFIRFLQIWFVLELTRLSLQNRCTPFRSMVITGERFDYIWTWVQTCPRLHMGD